MMPIAPRTIIHNAEDPGMPLASRRLDARPLRSALRFLSAILATVVAAACASVPLTAEQAKQQADLPLALFLTQRYHDRNPLVASPGVSYTAFYKSHDYNQLLRPAIDLMRFCEAKGGKLVHEGVPDQGRAVMPRPPTIEAAAPLESALGQKGFGTYRCSDQQSRAAMWRASVWPVVIYPPDSHSMYSYKAVVAIRPL